MNKLTSVDARRVLSILDECVVKLNFLPLLTTESVGANQGSLASVLGEDASAVLELRDKESKFLAFISGVEDENADSKLTPEDEADEAFRHVCRLLRDRPDLQEKFRTLQSKTAIVTSGGTGAGRNPPVRSILSAFEELRDLTYQRLITSVEEEKSQKDYLTEIIKKERKVGVDVRVLSQQLIEARQQREREAAQRKQAITKLKDELKDVYNQTAAEAKILEQETILKETSDSKTSQTEQATLKDELNNIRNSLDEKTTQNKKRELFLRKKKLRIEKELENWITKYDQEMEEKETELEQLRSDYKREQKELQEVDEGYERLLREREAMLAEDRRLEALNLSEIDKKKKSNDAAVVIQRAWKVYIQRKKTPATKKKGKKGGSPTKKGQKTSSSSRGNTKTAGGKGNSPSRPQTSRSPSSTSSPKRTERSSAASTPPLNSKPSSRVSSLPTSPSPTRSVKSPNPSLSSKTATPPIKVT